MTKLARLFHNADEVADAWREALRNRDVKGALDIWLDDDSITCVLPEGHRLSGHAEIRKGLERLFLSNHYFWNRLLVLATRSQVLRFMTLQKQYTSKPIK